MAAHLITNINRYLVDTIDDAPTDCRIGSRAYALDTSLWYIFDGSTWSELTEETVTYGPVAASSITLAMLAPEVIAAMVDLVHVRKTVTFAAVAATSTLTIGVQSTPGKSLIPNNDLAYYTFTATPEFPGDIGIGASAAEERANIVAALNGTDGFNIDANEFVSAAIGAGNTVILTARIPGAIGNSLTIDGDYTDDAGNSATAFSGGGGGGDIGEHTLFTHTGRVLLERGTAYTPDGLVSTNNDGTITLGIPGLTNELNAAQAPNTPLNVDLLLPGYWWAWNDQYSDVVSEFVSNLARAVSGGTAALAISEDVVCEILTHAIVSGTLIVDLWYRQITDDGALVGD